MNSLHSFDRCLLTPVLSLYAQKISTRVLKEGDRIGYGGDYVASSEMKVSTYDLGYGDGWCRGDAGTSFYDRRKTSLYLDAYLWTLFLLQQIQNEICVMDDAHDTAKHLGTISYEVITALHSNIERRLV